MTETAAADLYAEITNTIKTLREHVPPPDEDFYPEGEHPGNICDWALEDLGTWADEWQHRTVLLADAVEQLHNVAHVGPFMLCRQDPCMRVFVALVDGRKAAR